MPKVFVKGGSAVNLTSNDFLDEGGAGKVYVRGQTAYKVYHKTKDALPEAKIQELSVIKSPNVIKPEHLLLNEKNQPIGYTMRFVKGTNALCQLFTKAFRQREGISDYLIINLVEKMQSTIQHIHSHKILIVDLNEMNFLVSSKFDEVYFIDVDSYQTTHFPAGFLMESVRDRHTKGFSELTDWFSFAIVSFQLFVGIHPFKGKHPSIITLEDRMRENVSVLSKDVRIPAICPKFNVIPSLYLQWYERVFNHGERLPPPNTFSITVPVSVIVPTPYRHATCNVFDIAEIGTFDSHIVMYTCSGGATVIATQKSVYVNGNRASLKGNRFSTGFTSRGNKHIIGYPVNGYVTIHDLIKQEEVFECLGKEAMAYQGRLYVLSGSVVAEYNGMSIVPVCNVLENATQLFEGIVFQNLLGSAHASFFPAPGECNQVFIKELDGYKVLQAKFENGVLMVIGIKGGVYDRFIFRFDKNDWSYDCRAIKDVSLGDLNFVVLDTGVAVSITEEEKMEVFSSKKNAKGIKVIEDKTIDGDMKLCHNGAKLMYSKGNKLFSIRMK